MKDEMNPLPANGMSMSNIQRVALSAFFWSVFGLFTMNCQMANNPNNQSEIEIEEVCSVADFETANEACTISCPVQFINLSTNTTSYHWDFGDRNTSTPTNPLQVYQEMGTYQVR
ncbi:MAG: PKD domain-containing protein [Saprospiraceae bacterium]|nr:PKD domain-containing protein [Saprospiraceae bacterium]